MESTLERLEGNLVRLTITVPAEEVAEAVADAYKGVAGSIRVAGFRKGKVPRPVVDTHVGRDAVLGEAQQLIVERSYPKAVDELGLRTIGQPDVGELELPTEGEAYTFTAEVEVRPELTLSSDDPVTVEVPPTKASDAEVEEQVEAMRERFGTLEPVTDRGIESGDFALISFRGTVDGEEYEGNTVDKYLYETGRGLMPPEFDTSLMGAKAGDDVVSEFEIPDTSSNPEMVGKMARFEISVEEVKQKVLPELDDEFATSAGGFDSMDELRADIRGRLDEQKARNHQRNIETAVRAKLAERLEGDVPDSLVESVRDAMIRDFFNSLEARGITLMDYVKATDVDPEQIQRDIGEQAVKSVKEELALEALFRAKGMEVTDADVDESLSELAGEDRDVDEIREKWRAAGVLPVVREQVVHRKAVHWLLDNVTVVEKEPGQVGNNETSTSAGGEEPSSGKKKTSRKKKDTTTEETADSAPAADDSGSEE